MSKKLIYLAAIFCYSLSWSQIKETQSEERKSERSAGPPQKMNGQYPAKANLEKMAYIALPFTPIRLNPGTNNIDLRDFTAQWSEIQEVTLDGKKLERKERNCAIVAPIGSAMSVLTIALPNEVISVPVINTEKVQYTFEYTASRSDAKVIAIAGSFNGWSRTATLLNKNSKGKWTTLLNLDPGVHAYRIWEDGVEKLDSNNPLKMDNGLGGENSYFTIAEKGKSTSFLSSEMIEGRNIILHTHGTVEKLWVFFNNQVVTTIDRKEHVVKITLPASASEGYLRVFAANGEQLLNDVLIPVHQGAALLNERFLPRQNQHAQIMYFMMVDRFSDGKKSNNFPTYDPEILPKANTMGGDLSGIYQKINQSYFSQLGVNTLWISPISRNVDGAWGLWDKGVKSKFSAYHGYWPLSLTKIDKRFGTEQELDTLLNTAHQRQLNVVVDYVAHHVHQDHPLVKKNKNWTTPLYLPDGSMNTERWDDHRLTTWFDTFLPTFDFARPEVIQALSDTALFWVKKYPIDGFRHDATKHIHTEFWRELTFKIKQERKSDPMFQIGETYGSPELISSYVSSGLLDAQFDFNLYDAAVDAFAKDQTDFKNLDRVMKESLKYYGHHHLMGNITGNQDRARFVSYADGSIKFEEDAKLAGWTRDIQNRGGRGFRKMEQLMAFIMTTPGVPCIYYGDEIGMPGGNDPDNRRIMQFDQLNNEQRKLKSAVSKLTHLRSKHLALTYGDTYVLRNDSVFAYVRKYFGDMVLVVFNKADRNAKDSVWLELNVPSEWMRKNFQGEMGSRFKSEGGKWWVDLSGKGYDVFTVKGSKKQGQSELAPRPMNPDINLNKADKKSSPTEDKKKSNPLPRKLKSAEAQPVPNRKPDER